MESISNLRVSGFILSFYGSCFSSIHNASSVDPDQMLWSGFVLFARGKLMVKLHLYSYLSWTLENWDNQLCCSTFFWPFDTLKSKQYTWLYGQFQMSLKFEHNFMWNWLYQSGDKCIQNFHLGRYIVGFMIGNFVWRRGSRTVKRNFQP